MSGGAVPELKTDMKTELSQRQSPSFVSRCRHFIHKKGSKYIHHSLKSKRGEVEIHSKDDWFHLRLCLLRTCQVPEHL